MFDKIKETTAFLKQKIGTFVPQYGIVLGTGLGKLADEIQIDFEFPYNSIPNFVEATVESHKARLIFGKIAGKTVICMQGRFHYYEGHSMSQITFPIRLMKSLGIEKLLISNAAGGLNPNFSESDLMIINDHISQFLPENPLIGPNIMGDRFPDMSEVYDPVMIRKAKEIALKNNISRLKEGVYVSVTGPQLETKAEYRMLRILGADAVGMSTVPEVIVARQMDIPVFGISVITDMCVPETLQKAEISKILANAATAEPNMTFIFKELIAQGA
jgi:purine-nucleoside phosphorylase